MIYTCPICKRPHLFGKIVNELFKCVVKVTKEHKCLGRCGATLKVTLNPIRIPILFGLFHRNGNEYKSADVRVVGGHLDESDYGYCVGGLIGNYEYLGNTGLTLTNNTMNGTVIGDEAKIAKFKLATGPDGQAYEITNYKENLVLATHSGFEVNGFGALVIPDKS